MSFGKRIVIGTEAFKIGGFSTHTVSFGQAFRAQGHEVHVLITEPFGGLYPDFKDKLDSVVNLRRGYETRNLHLKRVVRTITALKPDVLINNAQPFVQAAFPYLSDKIVKISVVHNVMPEELTMGLANDQWCDWVVAVSDNIQAALKSNTTESHKIKTIPVGVKPVAHLKRQNGNLAPLRLIYVGRFWPQKNIPGLLAVLDALHHARVAFTITMVGDGPDLPAAREHVSQSDYRQQVQFLGARRPEEVGNILDNHDFCLMTSHFEGTPHVVLEAMAHGLVMLASRIPGSTDRIITHGVDGFLCDRNSPQEYVALLKRLSQSQGEFVSVSRAAQSTIQSRYSVPALAGQYLTLFDQKNNLVSSHQKPAAPSSPKVCQELLPLCPGFFKQSKHRLGDLWRQWAKNQHPAI